VLSHDRRDASDRLLPSTLFLNLYPRSRFSTCLVTCRLEQMVRSKGPSFHDALDPLRRAVRQRGRVFTGASLSRVVSPRKSPWSRSVHDFTSDVPSPSGARFRLCRTACVGTRRIEIAFTAPREESDYPRSETPSSASERRVRPQKLPRLVLRRRRGCLPRASRTVRLSAFERQRRNENEVCNLKIRRAGTTD